MKIFANEEDCIAWLKTRNLKDNGIGMGVMGKRSLDGFLYGPWYVTGYLYDKETLRFPVGERFKIDNNWGNKEDAEKQIERIRRAVK